MDVQKRVTKMYNRSNVSANEGMQKDRGKNAKNKGKKGTELAILLLFKYHIWFCCSIARIMLVFIVRICHRLTMILKALICYCYMAREDKGKDQ